MSNIRVRKPDTIHSWGIEFNYNVRTDFDAPAGEFVAACNRYLHNKSLFPGVIWFHQCGSDTAPRFRGYQFFECWGYDEEGAATSAARIIAALLGCEVEE